MPCYRPVTSFNQRIDTLLLLNLLVYESSQTLKTFYDNFYFSVNLALAMLESKQVCFYLSVTHLLVGFGYNKIITVVHKFYFVMFENIMLSYSLVA